MVLRKIKKSTIIEREKFAKNDLKSILEIKKLQREGFFIPFNVFSDHSTSRQVMEKKLDKVKKNNPKNRIIQRAIIKGLFHPRKNKIVYVSISKR